MTEYPVPLDNLIAYVKTLHPDGGPLDHVTDAFSVSEQLDQQADRAGLPVAVQRPGRSDGVRHRRRFA